MKKVVGLFLIIFFISSCGSLKPVTIVKNENIKDYRYIYISQTESLTSSSGSTIGDRFYSSSKSVNPGDVISGILAKDGFILIPELKNDIADETLVVNYGESGKRNRGLGYTIEVTIQFVSFGKRLLVSSCSAEGQGETEADDIREAISRCLNELINSK